MCPERWFTYATADVAGKLETARLGIARFLDGKDQAGISPLTKLLEVTSAASRWDSATVRQARQPTNPNRQNSLQRLFPIKEEEGDMAEVNHVCGVCGGRFGLCGCPQAVDNVALVADLKDQLDKANRRSRRLRNQRDNREGALRWLEHELAIGGKMGEERAKKFIEEARKKGEGLISPGTL